MRREYFQLPAGLRDAMQFRHESDHIRNVFDYVAANNLFKLVIGEGIRKDAEIVNDVGMTTRVGVDTDRAGKFILATTYVQNSLRGFGHALSFSATANWRTGPG
jgi:hypothetical protein